jgi:phage terminase large subunit-like protein
LVHTKGVWAGQSIHLEPFQVFLLVNLFGWLEIKTGLRRYREAFVLLPRKMGKSLLAGGIALYMTFADGEIGAEGYSGATSLHQAKEVFTPAKRMVETTPGLADALDIETHATSIFSQTTNSSFRPVIAKTKDGASPHVAICDELHQALDDTQISAFRTGMGARLQPLLLVITTAGVNMAGVCRTEQLEAEAVLAGTKKNDRLFALIYTLDPEDDWKDFGNWAKANPNMNVSVSEAYLRDQLEQALQSPAKQAQFRTKHLNQWVASASGWLTTNLWASAAQDGLKLSDLYGSCAYLAVDISTKQDLTALCLVIPRDDKRYIFPISFLPAGALDSSPNASAYAGWIADGFLRETPGSASSFEEIEACVGELCDNFNIVHAVFDQWQGEGLRQKVAARGIDTSIWVSNNRALWTTTLDDFEADLKNGKLIHPNDPVMNWCAANISINERGVTRIPVKPAKHLKIDTMITALMAFAASCVDAPAPPPVMEVIWL